MDSRTAQLAQNLIRYSTDLQPGENILIEMFDDALPLAQALVDEVYRAGGVPFLSLKKQPVATQTAVRCIQRATASHRRLGIDEDERHAGVYRHPGQRKHQRTI